MLKNKIINILGLIIKQPIKTTLAILYYVLISVISVYMGISGIPFFIMAVSIPVIVLSIEKAVVLKSMKPLIKIVVCMFIFIMSCCILPQQPEELNPISITITNENIQFNEIGEKETITYTTLPSNIDSSKIIFISDDSNIAKFDGNELIANSSGSTYIYASYNNGALNSEKIKVTVSSQTEENKKTADKLIQKINDIDNITLENTENINNLYKEFNSYNEDIKKLVYNSNILIAAVQTCTQLQEESENQKSSTKITTNNQSAKNIYQSSQNSITQQSDAGTTPQNNNSSEIVYRGQTGDKYHRQNCHTLKGNGIAISYSEAIAQGRDACKICKP